MPHSPTEQPDNSGNKEIKFIGLTKAGEALGVDRTTVYYYVKQLKLEMHKFPLDRKAYITVEDLERIKAAKQAAVEGQR